MRKRVYSLLNQTCVRNKIIILNWHVAVDFVYMVLSCPTRLAPSDIAKFLKGRTSKMLQEEFLGMKQGSHEKSLWERGYLCKSIGEVTKEMLRAYVDGQRGGDFQS